MCILQYLGQSRGVHVANDTWMTLIHVANCTWQNFGIFVVTCQILTKRALKSLLILFIIPNQPTRHLSPFTCNSSISPSEIEMPFSSPLVRGKIPPGTSYFSAIPLQQCRQPRVKERKRDRNSSSGNWRETKPTTLCFTSERKPKRAGGFWKKSKQHKTKRLLMPIF